MGKLSILVELLEFLYEFRLYWIVPIVIALVGFGIVLALSGSSPLFTMLYAP